MRIYSFDPILDSRWDDLVDTHPSASVFHRSGWLKALACTYGYRPVALTTSAPCERLSNAIVFCKVKSWITGNRLVSLPFSDHCEPLLNNAEEAFEFAEWMRMECLQKRWKYIEIRPLQWKTGSEFPLVAGESFWLHTLNLTPPLDQIFRELNRSCIQRRIRRAQREGLFYEVGSSDQLLDAFYGLHMTTRRRHRLIPQPRSWFRNLVTGMNASLEIRVASKGANPIAAILTLRHCETVVYKYGCSDERFHHLAGMPFLFWNLIEEAKAAGANKIDFGRTDIENDGLVRFKDEFGTSRLRLTYLRYPDEGLARRHTSGLSGRTARHLFSVLPNALFSVVGGLLYRHAG